MTQEELANKVGCPSQAIVDLEEDKYVPSFELAFKIAEAPQVKLEDVFQYIK